MKALTLTQPWASLVALGVKSVETRSWSTAYRGPLAIHAAKGWPREAQEAYDDWHTCTNLPSVPVLGAVVAIARLVDVRPAEVVAIEISEEERDAGYYAAGRFAWILRDVIPLRNPIPVRGALSLWEWDAPQGLVKALAEVVA